MSLPQQPLTQEERIALTQVVERIMALTREMASIRDRLRRGALTADEVELLKDREVQLGEERSQALLEAARIRLRLGDVPPEAILHELVRLGVADLPIDRAVELLVRELPTTTGVLSALRARVRSRRAPRKQVITGQPAGGDIMRIPPDLPSPPPSVTEDPETRDAVRQVQGLLRGVQQRLLQMYYYGGPAAIPTVTVRAWEDAPPDPWAPPRAYQVQVRVGPHIVSVVTRNKSFMTYAQRVADFGSLANQQAREIVRAWRRGGDRWLWP